MWKALWSRNRENESGDWGQGDMWAASGRPSWTDPGGEKRERRITEPLFTHLWPRLECKSREQRYWTQFTTVFPEPRTGPRTFHCLLNWKLLNDCPKPHVLSVRTKKPGYSQALPQGRSNSHHFFTSCSPLGFPLFKWWLSLSTLTTLDFSEELPKLFPQLPWDHSK